MNSLIRKFGSLIQSQSCRSFLRQIVRFIGSETEEYPHRVYDKDFERVSQDAIDRSPLSADQLNFVLPIFKKKRKDMKRIDCLLCHVPPEDLSYLNYTLLNFFIDGSGQIYSRKRTGCCSKHQHRLSREIKKARTAGLLSHGANLQLGEINNMYNLFQQNYMDDEIKNFFEKTPLPESIDKEQAEEFRNNFNLKPFKYESDLPRVKERYRKEAEEISRKLKEIFILMSQYYEVLSVCRGEQYADLMSIDDDNLRELSDVIIQTRENIQDKLAMSLRPMPTLNVKGKTLKYIYSDKGLDNDKSESSIEANNDLYLEELEKQYIGPMREEIMGRREIAEYQGLRSFDFLRGRKPHIKPKTTQENLEKKIFSEEEDDNLYEDELFDEYAGANNYDSYEKKGRKSTYDSKHSKSANNKHSYNKEIIDDHFEYTENNINDNDNDNLQDDILLSGDDVDLHTHGDSRGDLDNGETDIDPIDTKIAQLKKIQVGDPNQDTIMMGKKEDISRRSISTIGLDGKSELFPGENGDPNGGRSRKKVPIDPKIKIKIIDEDETEN